MVGAIAAAAVLYVIASGKPGWVAGGLRPTATAILAPENTLPAANHAGNRRAEDGRQPEQPELRDIDSASKQRRAGITNRSGVVLLSEVIAAFFFLYVIIGNTSKGDRTDRPAAAPAAR